jgi:hypothetical protein
MVRDRQPLADITSIEAAEITRPDSEDEDSSDEEDDNKLINEAKSPLKKFDYVPKQQLRKKNSIVTFKSKQHQQFDHHHKPSGKNFAASVELSKKFKEQHKLTRKNNPDFMYTEEDLENQIEAWHLKDTPYVINRGQDLLWDRSSV